MSVKVWVKCSGMTDDEALGIQVLSDGTALDVVEACKGVFRWPKLSTAALCTEGGEIVPPSSAAASLTNLTLQIVQFPPLASVLKRNASHRPLSTGHRKDQVPTTSTPSILCFQNVTIPRRGKRRMNPNAKKREAVGTPTRIARLWDSLPVAELAFVSGSDPRPAQALCAWSCRSTIF
ncbi:uncharacterized protein TEOVI_000179400 [Trypanosoma equiperdum]|uniref:Uncharacterized protein n=2 Tax=Trypanozoon TaxID=39700 RepID=Q383G0_TRYB2|nr:hypothetical protein, conserved [Trypanosoma brucei brucei TREU927]EAN80071.1 hypothetical protein, conserved [Trypanosoma brucei brucei TREU927]SCU70221.1 hypothetical protein, conserved [Trypanosoma equiperdum]